MRRILLPLVILAVPATAHAQAIVYEGTWVTTNRPLDGTLSCAVTDLGGNQWRGHFSGEWRGRPFSYTVDFSGPPEKLHGKAIIDGAEYEWTGSMSRRSPGWFRARFGGNRYVGGFDLKEKTD